jgi:hypothetical protein
MQHSPFSKAAIATTLPLLPRSTSSPRQTQRTGIRLRRRPSTTFSLTRDASCDRSPARRATWSFGIVAPCTPVNSRCVDDKYVSLSLSSCLSLTSSKKAANTRAVCYICMLPRSRIVNPGKDIQDKRDAFTERGTTSHWPHRSKLFGKSPQTWGKELPAMDALPAPVLTELGKRLAGF